MEGILGTGGKKGRKQRERSESVGNIEMLKRKEEMERSREEEEVAFRSNKKTFRSPGEEGGEERGMERGIKRITEEFSRRR